MKLNINFYIFFNIFYIKLKKKNKFFFKLFIFKYFIFSKMFCKLVKLILKILFKYRQLLKKF